MVAQSLAPTITTSLAAIQGTNGTSTPNGLLKSSADSPATPASTSAAAPTSGAGKPEKAAKPAPRLAIDTTAEQLSAALGDKWEDYGRELNLFIVGKRTRAELQETLDLVLGSDPALKKLHNNLLMGILANASRDPPPQNGSFSGWNRNKKRKEPMTGRVKGSTKQKRLKTEIMALGPTERNRIKAFKAVSELEPVSNPLSGFEVLRLFVRKSNSQAERKLCPPVPGAILESRRAKSAPRLPKDKNFQPLPATQIQTIKGYNVPLASETLELPSVEDTFDRAQGMASEYLLNGVQDKVPQLVLDGLEVLPPSGSPSLCLG
jgi:transcriptional coactivator HFI1/ADA1